jgi:ribonuclease P protein subunit RPR2
MAKAYARKAEEQSRIARERIRILFEQAEKMFPKKPALSNRYVSLARTIGMKYKVRIPPHLHKKFCKYCVSYLHPPTTVRIRVQRGKIVSTCLSCKRITRYPYNSKSQ